MAWRDYRDLVRQMEYDMHRFTEEALRAFLDSPGAFTRFWQPAADIHETDRGIAIKLELAGIATDSVSVSLSGDGRQLTVSGIRSEPEDERGSRLACRQLEIYFGPFERTFPLPAECPIDRDAISATLKNGFLTIHLPRRPSLPRETRTIAIAIENDNERGEA